MSVFRLGTSCLLVVVWIVVGSASVLAGNVFLDPGIRHTNGMRIASSEPQRAPSVYWSCNPEKIGYCGGNYYRPCIDSMRPTSLMAGYRGCYSQMPGRYNPRPCPVGPRCSEELSSADGLEQPGMTQLGQLRSVGISQGAPQGVPQVFPSR